MNNLNKWVIGIVVLIVVFIGFSYLNNKKLETDGDIKIGALLVLSGDAASWGENAQKGISMAVDEYNNASGGNIQIVFEDTGGENKRAVSGYRKLIDIDKVSAVIGPLFQAEVASISSLVSTDKIPVVTPSFAPIQNRPNPRNPLMIWMDPSTEAERMAEYVFSEEVKTVSVIGTLDSWENLVSDSFAKKFEAIGGTVLSKEIVQPDTTDIRLTIVKALANDPDAVFVGTYYQFIPTTRILSELGFEGKVFSIEVDSYLAEETTPFSDNIALFLRISIPKNLLGNLKNYMPTNLEYQLVKHMMQ